MSISGLGFAFRTHLPIRSHIFIHSVRKVRLSSVASIETLDEASDGKDVSKRPEWKKLNSKDLGICNSLIAKPTRKVLNGLKRKGFEVYLVGGSVRDLILNRKPKDFDIITTAELKEVLRTFSRCEIVGKRFPICHVHMDNIIVEVSSFSTSGRIARRKLSYAYERPTGCDEEDYIRWRNCLHRDFTINGLMFDPYANIVYDYMGGMEDIRKAKVRTVIPAATSFQEDCARILRAIRIAARLGFRFPRDTAHAVKNLACTILRLDKARLLMEMNYMLAYGSAEASLRLLWKFGILDILLPIQAAYLVQHGFRRRDRRTNMLLSLFSNLDKLLAPNKPCHGSLWVSILALHKALADQPRDPLVIATFSLAVHNGGDLFEAVKIARRISRPYEIGFNELVEPQNLDAKALIYEVMDLAASVKGAIHEMTDEHFVSQAMSGYPKAPYSDLVFISFGLHLRVCKIFECVIRPRDKGYLRKQGSIIDYELLGLGSLQEVRHVFARVVFDTVYPLNLNQQSTHKC